MQKRAIKLKSSTFMFCIFARLGNSSRQNAQYMRWRRTKHLRPISNLHTTYRSSFSNWTLGSISGHHRVPNANENHGARQHGAMRMGATTSTPCLCGDTRKQSNLAPLNGRRVQGYNIFEDLSNRSLVPILKVRDGKGTPQSFSCGSFRMLLVVSLWQINLRVNCKLMKPNEAIVGTKHGALSSNPFMTAATYAICYVDARYQTGTQCALTTCQTSLKYKLLHSSTGIGARVEQTDRMVSKKLFVSSCTDVKRDRKGKRFLNSLRLNSTSGIKNNTIRVQSVRTEETTLLGAMLSLKGTAAYFLKLNNCYVPALLPATVFNMWFNSCSVEIRCAVHCFLVAIEEKRRWEQAHQSELIENLYTYNLTCAPPILPAP
eukprot:5995528-Amphidinium_carterae.1